MTKAELVNFVCKENENLTKKDCSKIIDSVFRGAKSGIKNSGQLSYPGFGTFVKRARKARKGRDPRTGAEISIKASNTVGFRIAKAFKEQI